MSDQHNEEYWKEKLSPEEYETLRRGGTDTPFTGKYVDNHEDGTYTCGACGKPLFSSETKFESGSGWPSFYDVLSKGNVELKQDSSHGTRLPTPDAVGNGGQVTRTEVVCANCGSHLGHLFDDGPQDKTGQRYCINSTSLNFKPKE